MIRSKKDSGSLRLLGVFVGCGVGEGKGDGCE